MLIVEHECGFVLYKSYQLKTPSQIYKYIVNTYKDLKCPQCGKPININRLFTVYPTITVRVRKRVKS